MSAVSPDDVNRLTRPTDGFLCPMNANTYGIEFLQFAIMDYDTKNVLFEVGKNIPPPADMSLDFSSTGEDIYRKIRYNFSEDVLRLPFIQTTLVFSVGDREIQEFRMIERHYFRDRLVKSFDFGFGFCIPGSVNTWESVYSLPPLPESLIDEMIENPYETQSDSFYFVNNKLIMHNKASYKYFREDLAQAKKSYEDKFGSKGVKGVKAGDKPAKAGVGFKEEVYLDAADAKSAAPAAGEAKMGAKAAAKEAADVWSKESDYI